MSKNYNSKEYLLTPRCCPKCGQFMSAEYLAARFDETRERKRIKGERYQESKRKDLASKELLNGKQKEN